MHSKKLAIVRKALSNFKCSAIYVYLLVIHIPAVTLLETSIENLKEPHIWLNSYQKVDSIQQISVDTFINFNGDFGTDYLSKDGSDYVISDSIFSVDFTCEAAYPITWSFPLEKQVPTLVQQFGSIETGEYRISKFYSYSSAPVNIQYRKILRIYFAFLNFLSVNLTCNSVENHVNLRSSIYLYLKGKNVIEHQQETLTVFAEMIDKSFGQPPLRNITVPPVVIPCRPATPDMTVSLEKQDSSSPKIWKPLPPQLQQDLSFDPKVGFSLQRQRIGNEIFGLYRCSVMMKNGTEFETNSKQFVQVVVKAPNSTADTMPDPPSSSFQSRSIIHGKASAGLEITNLGETAFKCCSGGNSTPPKMYFEYCINPVQCELLKNSFLEDIANGKVADVNKPNPFTKLISLIQNKSSKPSDCVTAYFVEDDVLAVCQQEDMIDFAEHYIAVFHPLAGGSVVNRSQRIGKADLKNNGDGTHRLINGQENVSLTRYEPASILEANGTTAEKMMIVAGHGTRSKKFPSLSLDYVSIDDRDIENSYSPYRTDENTSIINDIIDILKSPNRIAEYNRDYYYQGEPIIFMCFGIKFEYEKGAHLMLNWKNGSKSLLNDLTSGAQGMVKLHSLHMSGNAYMFNGVVKAHSVFGRSVLAAKEMSSVDCWMPIQNSKKWEKISKEITVLDSVSPAFIEVNNEKLYLYVGKVGKVISCTLERGTPSPSLIATRNGKPLKVDFDQSAKNQTKPLPQPGAFSKEDTKQTHILDENKHVIGIEVAFSWIGHDDHGTVFQCIAKNVNGTTTRNITIFVKEKPSMLVLVSLSCVAILLVVCFALGVMGVKHLCNKNRESFH